MSPLPADRATSRAWVRCYAELNDLLPRHERFVEIPIDFDVSASVKDVIERIGVPHTEVDLVVLACNGMLHGEGAHHARLGRLVEDARRRSTERNRT